MQSTVPQPTIGRIVHYWVLNSEECHETPNPAIVLRAHSDNTIDLHVFGDTGLRSGPDAPEPTPIRVRVPNSADGRAGTWCWPPRT